MWRKLFSYVVLPSQVSEFERDYLQRVNKIALWFFVVHLPVFTLIAHFNQTGPGLALLLTLAVIAGPALAYRAASSPRLTSVVYGVAAMLMGGLLVHFGQGPVQIEMHFYFFALLAMLAVFGNPLVVAVAAVTAAVHHALLWLYLPTSIFNYDAPFWVVAIHAAFVVLEATASCYIARSFFDNVIGLEKIVQARTLALDARNRDMREVMDHVDQGLFTLNRDGEVASERSAVVEKWLGEIDTGTRFHNCLGRISPSAGEAFEFGWDQVIEDFLPIEMTLEQLPSALEIESRHFELEYSPIHNGEELAKVLVVMSDVTARVEQERLEAEQREVLGILGRVARDKIGFLEFLEEARELIHTITGDDGLTLPELKRAVHTLKGNTMLFGINTVAGACHIMESYIDDESDYPTADMFDDLRMRWENLAERLVLLVGAGGRSVELDDEAYTQILQSVLDGDSHEAIARQIATWKMELTGVRLSRIGDQAKSIAQRLNKSVEIEVKDNGLRLDPVRWASFWSVFVHMVRNSVDHGIEPLGERTAAGKAAVGKIELATRVEGESFVVSIQDDGAGIGWDALAAKAKEVGMPHKTREDLIEALYSDGVSTMSEVSAFSGRGVGCAAVRAEVLARGGSIVTESTPGQGTRIEFRFATSEMVAPSVEDYLVAS